MKPATGSRGFFFLNITQFFGAANDNILKQLLIFGVAAGGLWEDLLGPGAQAYASLCLAVPFVLLSGFAGQFSDRFSKRNVSIVVKLSEIFIALLAMYGLWLMNLWIVLAAMVLISVQSTFFTPAKYGILPEILDEKKLSRANGTINMFTYIAVILGGAVGGLLYDAYVLKNPNTEPMLWLPGLILLLVAVLGTAASFGIPRLIAEDTKLKIRPQFFRTYVSTWREIAGTPLAAAIIAWSYYYLIVGGIAIMILPDYKELLGISHTKTALLMALLGISIGIGDFVAGRASGHRIRPELIPIGAIGTSVMFFILGVIPLNFNFIAICLALAGFLAGFYMVPLQTMTQQFSSQQQRGRVLGLWSCGSFVGVILGNLVFLAVKSMGMASNRVFLICGLLGLVCVAAYYFHWQRIFKQAVEEVSKR